MKQKPNFDFSQPNKLDRKALWLVLGNAFWGIFRSLWPIFVALAINGLPNKEDWKYAYLGFFAIVVLLIARLSINYFYYSFQVIEDELIIKKGWLNKSKTVIKLDKIHEVNLSQKLIHKIIGLYIVGVDTAGSSKTEITINGIGYSKALALKEVLTNTEIETTRETSEIHSEEETEQHIGEQTENEAISKPVVQQENISHNIVIGLSSLIKIGLTRNYLQTFGLLVAFSFQIIEQLRSFFSVDDEEASKYNEMIQEVNFERLGGLLILILILGLVLFIMLFNLGRTLLAYYNYKIQLKNKHLTVSYGLTDSHIIAVPSNKVQIFQIKQNYFQKLMNLFEVSIKQIESSENNKKKKGLIVPGANQAELKQIFEVIYQKDLDIKSKAYKPHKRILFLKFLWLCIPAAIALGVFYFTENLPYSWIILPFFVLIYFLIWCGYRNEKLYIEDDFIILKNGVWDISTTYLQINKIQKVTVRQSFFQEGKNLGSLDLDTAAGTVTLFYYDFELLQNLANELIYKIEKNKYKWM